MQRKNWFGVDIWMYEMEFGVKIELV